MAKVLGGSSEDMARSVIQSADGGIVVAGYTRSNDGDVSGNHGSDDAWLVKLDGAGTLLWQKPLGGSDFDIATTVQLASDGAILLAGWTRSYDGDVSLNQGQDDLWVVKLNADNVGVEELAPNVFSVVPNPSEGVVHINCSSPLRNARFTLTDAQGREVLHDSMVGSSHVLDLGDRPRGIYLLTLRSAEGIYSQRVVLD